MNHNLYALKPATPCRICGESIDPRRVLLEKTTCLDCQADLDRTEPVKHTIVPLNKSNYIPITDMAMLAQLNPKRTT
jgi:RNA polymerase-binding transcription factor DksA